MAANWIFSPISRAIVLTVAAIALDWLTPVELEAYIAYVLAAVHIAWTNERRISIAVVVIFALSITLEAYGRDYVYSSSAVPILNLANKLASLAVLTWFVTFARDNYDEALRTGRTDPLTRLANRRAFVDRLSVELERLRDRERPLALAYVDLDGFKAVNDRLGHAVGDEVLIVTAETIHAHLRPIDLAARLGGDEFAIIFAEEKLDGAREHLSRIRAALHDRMTMRGWAITFSVGVVQAAPGDTIERLVDHADRVMLTAKTAGKDRIVAFPREQTGT